MAIAVFEDSSHFLTDNVSLPDGFRVSEMSYSIVQKVIYAIFFNFVPKKIRGLRDS